MATSNPITSLNKEFSALKLQVAHFNQTTPKTQVNEAKAKLENLHVQLQQILQKNAGNLQVILALGLATDKKNGILALLNQCKALLPTAPSNTTETKKEEQTDTKNTNDPTTAYKAHHAASRSRFDTLKKFDENFKTRTLHRPALTSDLFSPPEISSSSTVKENQNTPSIVTEIRVKCKIPFGHSLQIHGEGANLDWQKGANLQKIDDETYVYRYEGSSGPVQFKLVADGSQWENCNNRTIEIGKAQEIQPALSFPEVPVIVNFNGKDNDKLFIRGTGPKMSWDKGIELKQINGQWVFETDDASQTFEFKILLNDQQWELDSNHKVEKGQVIIVIPRF